MGDVILLQRRRRRGKGPDRDDTRQRGAGSRGSARPDGGHPGIDTVFYFDLACPFSYLAAERVERLLGEVPWVPVPGALLEPRPWVPGAPSARTTAQRRARSLRLPLIWPQELGAAGVPGAMRVAALATEDGCGRQFALAAMRLQFCGGYDLEAPATVSEAAAAAGMDVESCLAAMHDNDYDEDLVEAAALLASANVRRLPAFQFGERLLDGEQALGQVSALRRVRAARPATPPSENQAS